MCSGRTCSSGEVPLGGSSWSWFWSVLPGPTRTVVSKCSSYCWGYSSSSSGRISYCYSNDYAYSSTYG